MTRWKSDGIPSAGTRSQCCRARHKRAWAANVRPKDSTNRRLPGPGRDLRRAAGAPLPSASGMGQGTGVTRRPTLFRPTAGPMVDAAQGAGIVLVPEADKRCVSRQRQVRVHVDSPGASSLCLCFALQLGRAVPTDKQGALPQQRRRVGDAMTCYNVDLNLVSGTQPSCPSAGPSCGHSVGHPEDLAPPVTLLPVGSLGRCGSQQPPRHPPAAPDSPEKPPRGLPAFLPPGPP